MLTVVCVNTDSFKACRWPTELNKPYNYKLRTERERTALNSRFGGRSRSLVKLVMLTLVLASVTSWALIFQRAVTLTRAKNQGRAFEDKFGSGLDLVRIYREPSQEMLQSTEAVFRAGFKEFNRLRQQNGVDADALMEGVQRYASRRRPGAGTPERSLPMLATIGSISPYIGLFGTVWGIMNSFRGLATAQQATLATVAPGIWWKR